MTGLVKGEEALCEGFCHARRQCLHCTNLYRLFVVSGVQFGLVGERSVCEIYSSYTHRDPGLMGHI